MNQLNEQILLFMKLNYWFMKLVKTYLVFQR